MDSWRASNTETTLAPVGFLRSIRMFFGSPNRKLLLARKAVSLLVLGCVLFASAPLPLGLKLVQRGAGTPFPCMDCACGCATPEQCWTSCCCFTPAERQRWAEQHGVTPPSYAVLSDPAQNGSVLNRLLRNSELSDPSLVACGRSSCSKASPGNCASCNSLACEFCDTASEITTPADASWADPSGSQGETNSHVVTVVSVVALRCQGASSEFTLLPWAIVETGTADVTSPEVIADPYVVFSETAACLGIAPTTPPPKC